MEAEERGSFLDPEKELHKITLFWVALGAPVVTAIGWAAAIAFYNWSSLCVSLQLSCVNGLLPTYKMPLGLASVGLLLGTLVAQMHRSGQTLAAMEMASANNEFSNRFKLKAEFNEFVDGLAPCESSVVIENHVFEVSAIKSFNHFSLYFPCLGGTGIWVDDSAIDKIIASLASSVEVKVNNLRLVQHQKTKLEIAEEALAEVGLKLHIKPSAQHVNDGIYTWEELVEVLRAAGSFSYQVATFMRPKKRWQRISTIGAKTLPRVYEMIAAQKNK